MRAAIINRRGFSGKRFKADRICGYEMTEDVRDGILFIRKAYPEAPLLGFGVSFGGMIMNNYLADYN